MKAKKLFFGALTCLAFAACSNDDDPIANGGVQDEGTAVMAVRISMPEAASTRAWADGDDTYGYHVNGDEKEIAISSVVLYFFDADGNKWGEPKDITETFNEQTDKTDAEDLTIESKCDAFVVFNNIKTTPSKVVAVLNAKNTATEGSPATYTKYPHATVDELRTSISDDFNNTESGGFIMSNAVYKNGNDFVYAVDCSNKLKTAQTLAEAQEAATGDPVSIYVERVLARVSVNLVGTSGKYVTSTNEDVQLGYDQSNTIDIVAVPNGWWLDNTAQHSYLIKDLENYTNEATWWNSTDYKRSYWAKSYATTTGEKPQWYASYDYSTYKNNLADKYCYENTTADDNNKTQLVVAATLYEKTTNNEYKILQLVEHKTIRWKYSDFVNHIINQGYIKVKGTSDTEARLLTESELKAVANNKTDGTQKIGENDIEAWQAKLVLNTADGLTYYNGLTGEELANKEAAQTLLDDEVGAFKYWKNGQTYFFTKIIHYDDGTENATEATEYYGVVRNHKYVVSVTSIVGLGTPVPYTPEETTPTDPTDPETPPTDPTDPEYPKDPENPDDPDDPDPDDPDDPENPIDPEIPTNDNVTSMAAQINVLQYRVVKQDVTLDGTHKTTN